MNRADVTEYLFTHFHGPVGGKPIAIPPESDTPAEMIYELGWHQTTGDSEAVAAIDRSAPHYHKHTIEVYVLEEGVLTVHLGDKTIIMAQKGQILIIPPGTIHWAEASRTAFVRVICSPAWTPEDHILV